MNTTTNSDEFGSLTASVALGLLQQPTNRTERLFVNDVMALLGVNDVMALET
jgi:hypothetical protein